MSSSNEGSSARRIALTGLLAALALIFSYVEVLFPFNAGIPGVKLGLANLVPLIIMYRLDARYAFAANLIRVLLAGLLFSGLFAALYSLAGSCVSFFVMPIRYSGGNSEQHRRSSFQTTRRPSARLRRQDFALPIRIPTEMHGITNTIYQTLMDEEVFQWMKTNRSAR
jgi:hypothetical protein